MLLPQPQSLPMLGLGMSIGTPPGWHRSRPARGRQLCRARAQERRGAGQDRPLQRAVSRLRTDCRLSREWRLTSGCGRRGRGAVRSVGLEGLRTPHTGMLIYRDGVPRIPAAAIAGEDAARLARMAARGQRVRLPLVDGRHAASRRRIGQRHRRDARPGAAGRDRRRQRPLRFVGRGHRARPTMAAARLRPGKWRGC